MKKDCEKQNFPQILLVGNPNTGKTTLFNRMTNSNEHIGNWHGVTVEEKSKIFNYGGQTFTLVDLPGIYSMSALSYEEQVAIDYIRLHSKTKIINICDLNNLERNLSLTLGLLEYGLDVILAINCMDKKPYRSIDAKKLSTMLQIPVVEINANKGWGIEKLGKYFTLPFKEAPKPKYVFSDLLMEFQRKLNCERKEFCAIKLFEKDEVVASLLDADLEKCDLPEKSICYVANLRYKHIEQIKNECLKSSGRVYGKSKLDKLFLNRFLAFPIFILILCCVFYLTFFSVGKWLSEGLSWILDNTLGSLTQNVVGALFGRSSWIYGLVCEALIGGVGTVLSFLPQVGLLFLFLSLLEDSGYLSRVAFASEDIFGKLGLSGKSIYTLLMGFGCSTTAILTARNMDDKKAKIKTAMLTPFMSCSAKFPIYVVIGGAFFGVNNVFVILFLYLLGLAVALFLSFVYERTILKSKAQSFILEFPPYRWCGFKRLFSVLFDNMKTFLIRVGSLLIAMNVIVWLLSNFSFTFAYVTEQGGQSMLESLGVLIAPIFTPLGFGSWGISSALIAGFIAKEVIISSIAMFNNASSTQIGASLFNPASVVFFSSSASVVSFLVFCLLYCPCISSVAVLQKEIGKKWTAFSVAVQFAIAYICSLTVYHFALAFAQYGFWVVFALVIAFIVVLLCIFKLVCAIKKPRTCHGCKGCK